MNNTTDKRAALISPKMLADLKLYFHRVIRFQGNPIRAVPDNNSENKRANQ